MRCEKSGDRPSPTGAGAGYDRQGVSERRALALVHMSASSLRYTPAPDTNAALRARIVTLAHRHRRYGAGMIYLKLRQAGTRVNHKRVERLYRG